MDSIAGFYYPMITHKPVLCLFFGFIFIVISISLMNMVTAIIVQSALESAQMDTEMEAAEMRSMLKRLDKKIVALFQDLDALGTGEVSIKNVEEAIANETFELPEELQNKFSPDKLIELFELLDEDGSGDLNVDEFKNGIQQVVVSSVPIEITQILHATKKLVKDHKVEADTLNGKLFSVEEKL